MIGVDTNVLLRVAMNDDPVNTPKAMAFLSARSPDDPAHVNAVVLAEFVWALRSHYDMPRDRIALAVRTLVESEAFSFEHKHCVLRALDDFDEGVGHFTDRLIAEINDSLGCDATVTFDKHSAKRPPFLPVG